MLAPMKRLGSYEKDLKMEVSCQAGYSECGIGTNSGLFSGRRMEHSQQPKQRVHTSKPWSNSENILRRFTSIGQQTVPTLVNII